MTGVWGDPGQLEKQIFYLPPGDDKAFRHMALSAFYHQYHHNQVYRRYCDLLGASRHHTTDLEQVPFLPVEFFKSQFVFADDPPWEQLFTSSGTTGMERSSHYVKKLELYRKSFSHAFEYFYGPLSSWCLLALLPGYADNPNSSLIYMADNLIRQTGHRDSGFYLDNRKALVEKLRELEGKKQKTLLLGVGFALLDLAEAFPMNLEHTVVMETGGMKGRREEMTRVELHQRLQDGLGVERVHSEYGMAELLSQAYSRGNGFFHTPPWMRIWIRDPDDPFEYVDTGVSGGINIIDLANLYSCPFIETRDIGKKHPDGSFEVLGRFDHSDIRGCSLLVVD